MSFFKSTLAQIEAQLQDLIEGGAARIFRAKHASNDLAQQLVAALQNGIREQADGSLVAPNLFSLVVHPRQARELRDQDDLLEALSTVLIRSEKENGARFLSPPVLRIVEDPEAPLHQVQVVARISLEHLTQTTDLSPEARDGPRTIPSGAFLIVNGTQIHPLLSGVVNIGRRPDNQLVIDDGRVSRVHAQLRAVKGRFMIFDLDSSGGTYVNDQRIHQSLLYPGDVISLAGVPIVYGQDETGTGETQKYVPDD